LILDPQIRKRERPRVAGLDRYLTLILEMSDHRPLGVSQGIGYERVRQRIDQL
jgi:hypothetical protein